MVDPENYHGRIFKLSQNYPNNLPEKDPGVEAILNIDFKKDWKAYALLVRDYILEGNMGSTYENSFYLEDNKIRDWFHVPWQHWGPGGREGIHGLTQEGPLSELSLAPEQTIASHAYAVGFYNSPGGYTIGKLWPNTFAPDLDWFKAGNGFPEGTVVGKLLFAPYTEKMVPYLKDPVQWNAYIVSSDIPGNTKSGREIAPVRLLQMDIMVRDPRANNDTGWVFGTFVYNGALKNKNRWKNLMPVGLMWGNDPENKLSKTNPKPQKTIINTNLKQTAINKSPKMPPMHLGWNSRLNGPADNPASSCMSCHSTAQYPMASAIMPFLNQPPVSIPAEGSQADKAWMKWFRNVPCTEPFDKGEATSLDYSLQMADSVQNFAEYINQTQKGYFYEQYWEKGHKVFRNVFSGKK